MEINLPFRERLLILLSIPQKVLENRFNIHFTERFNQEIGIITISDHAPIAITVKFKPAKSSTFNWRLNAALLTDQSICDDIQDSIKTYFRNNADSDTNPLNNWEAHRSVIRGEFIKWGTRKKKDREKEITRLSNNIAKLELKQKQSLSSGVADELLHNRNSLKQLLDLQT